MLPEETPGGGICEAGGEAEGRENLLRVSPDSHSPTKATIHILKLLSACKLFNL